MLDAQKGEASFTEVFEGGMLLCDSEFLKSGTF